MEEINKQKDINQVNLKSQYYKMLNNLLGISNRDNAIFTKSREFNFDLKKFLFEKDFEKLFTEKNFKVELSATKIEDSLERLTNVDDANDFLYEVDNMAIDISMLDRKNIIKDFEKFKPIFLKKISKKAIKNIITQWQKFRSRYIDIQYQTNIWPLYVATCYLRVIEDETKINAPLFLKKVEIEVVNDKKIFIKTVDENVEINEKLLFVLKNDFNITLPDLDHETDLSFDEVVVNYKSLLKDYTKNRMKMRGNFEYLTSRKTKKTDLVFMPGITLSIVSPSGGSLRKRFYSFLNNEQKINNILKTSSKNLKKEVINDMRNRKGIFRITKTDASQEMAIMGAIKDHAIIWGPPGTGKSQTISNIIANLLYRRKVTVVTSEKKAALDVIKARMGKLSKFIFFGLVSKNMLIEDKKLFYKPFNELAKLLEEDIPTPSSIKAKSYVNNSQVAFSFQKHKLANENIADLINIAKILYHYKDIAERIFHIHHSVQKNSDIVYDFVKRGDLREILKEHNIFRNLFGFGLYPKDIRYLISATKIFPKDENLMNLANINNIEHVFDIENLLENEINFVQNKEQFINDIDYLELVLANRFKTRVSKLREDHEWAEKVDLFLKHSASGFRIPYKFISLHKEVIGKLYEVFVSTPQTLAAFTEHYPEYDYAIFDEASQMHIEQAIPFIGSAKISIIAGDNQQMRPSDFFAIRDKEADALGNSLLDYAYNQGLKANGHEYMLKKNYRSEVGELMLFSSKEFYDSKLDVIDNCEKMHLSAIDVYNVNGKWEGRVNDIEAHKALETTLKEANNYQSLILLTLNANQQQYMLKLIFAEEKYRPLIPLLDSGKLKLRNLENIQGDEAELVIISVAYDRTTALWNTYVTRSTGENALNVAISRAQKRMIVFKSLLASDIKKTNTHSMLVFKNWLKYLEMNKAQRNQYLIPQKKDEIAKTNLLTEDVFRSLKNHLYIGSNMNILKNVTIGSYSIDVAIIDRATNEFLFGIDIVKYEKGHGFISMIKNLERRQFFRMKNYPIFEITEIHWRVGMRNFINKIQDEIDRIESTWRIRKNQESRQ